MRNGTLTTAMLAAQIRVFRGGKFAPLTADAVLKRARRLGIRPKQIGGTFVWTADQARRLGAKGTR